MFTSIDKALVAAIMGILFIVQTYTRLSFWRLTHDTTATIIGLITPVLVWAFPTRRGPEHELAGGCRRRRGACSASAPGRSS